MGIVSFIIVEVQYFLNFHFVVCSVSFSCHLASKEYKNPSGDNIFSFFPILGSIIHQTAFTFQSIFLPLFIR